ncbi:restriction endonuclease subunit S [Pseudoalteromonas sp. HF66]|uniref:restriction endonuclease subunit S n=1 Tax=Pseudoalteromonas sp. HF66 TaxID=2721559 RepID=UPI00142FD1C1|nr:restriction endonuclease subunit S [Pseudoalteromonas sp. HF66]NIZ05442.1 restriction endonuclease subunit S [Pseudoalteromonas sp. HF66]
MSDFLQVSTHQASFNGNTVPLENLCISITDCPHSTPKWTDDGLIVLRSNNIKGGVLDLSAPSYTDPLAFQERIKRATPEAGDIVITREAPMGEVCLIPDGLKCCLGQRMVLLKVDPTKISSQYLLFALQSEFVQKQIRKSDRTGSTVSNLCIPDLKALEIPILFNTDGIAAILKSITGKIELNNRINAELEAMAKTLYDYWFVQFDFPDANGKPYKTSGGKMVYNPTLKREIPEGWSDCILGDHVTFKRGVSYRSGDIQDEGVPFLNLNSFSLSGEFKQTGTKYFNGKFKPESKLDAGELVIAITDVTRNADIIGKAFVIPDIFDEKPLISCDVACVSSKTFGVAYLEQLFNSNSYHKYIKHFASGTLVLHLDLQGVKWFKTHLPPKNLLDNYNKHCSSLFKQRDIVLKENVYLESLRDWLLPMLMNGQVTVK